MELIDSCRGQMEASIFRALVALFCMALLSGALLTLFALLGPKKISAERLPLPTLNSAIIGEGALALQEDAMLHHVLFVGANTRPDSALSFTFAERASGKRWTAQAGEELALHDVTITPHRLEAGAALCTLADGREVRMAPSAYFTEAMTDKPYFKQLQGGSVWPHDVFLAGWGRDAMRELGKKLKVCIEGAVFFLQVGERLGWNGDKWVKGSASGAPLAELVRTAQGAEFQVWDEVGFTVERVKVPLKGKEPFRFEIGAHLSAPRPRAKGEVSCLFGKRRVVIREGDWWIRAGEKWRQVRCAADFDAVLQHKLMGELCLFESVEVLPSKVVIRGHAFDPTRSEKLPLVWTAPFSKKRAT